MPVTAEPKATAIQDTSVENNLGCTPAPIALRGGA